MSGIGRFLDGYQPLILPLISMQRSSEDTWILVYGSSEVNNLVIGMRLQAPSFGCTAFRVAVRVIYLPYLLDPFNLTVLIVSVRENRPQLHGAGAYSAGGTKYQRCLLLFRFQ